MTASSSHKFATWSLVAMIALSPLRAQSQAQAVTEMHDPLRGVTFYSVQISTDPTTALQTTGSLFGESDLMTLGLSAFFFDESGTIDEYVLWLRHDGPRSWFTSNLEFPLTLWLDGEKWQSAPLHVSRPAGSGESGPFIEKLEFVLETNDLKTLLAADSATIELVTAMGTVEKTLSASERSALRRFHDRVLTRSAETQSVGAAGASN